MRLHPTRNGFVRSGSSAATRDCATSPLLRAVFERTPPPGVQVQLHVEGDGVADGNGDGVILVEIGREHCSNDRSPGWNSGEQGASRLVGESAFATSNGADAR